MNFTLALRSKLSDSRADFHYGWRISSTKSPKAGDAISCTLTALIIPTYAAMVEPGPPRDDYMR